MALLLGNLDCEEELAGRHRVLSAAARSAASGFATLLRAFAAEGDRLWTLDRVESGRVAAVPGLPRPELVHGQLDRIAPGPGADVLAWGETPSVHRVRRAQKGDRPVRGELPDRISALWSVPAPEPEVVARVNHRSFALDLARTRGWALPGARVVRTVPELLRHLEGGGLEAGGGRWVAKAPLSAAGRHRVIGRGRAEAGSEGVRRRLENLLQRSGVLVLEPWVGRVADFGCTALVAGGGRGEGRHDVRIVGIHRTEVDRTGAFLGLEIGPRVGGETAVGTGRSAEVGADRAGLRGAERALLEEAVRAAGRGLGAAGYAGPFGVDAFRWRDRAGALRLHPLSEINARLTFGWVGWALVERLRAPLGLGSGSRVVLRFGCSIPDRPGAVPLLLPAGGAPGAWLDVG